MNYFALFFCMMLIISAPIMPIDNDDMTLLKNNFKITKYGINCPIDLDLKKLLNKHYNEFFTEPQNNKFIGQFFYIKSKGVTWKVSVDDVVPELDIKTIEETKLTYYFNHRSDWCLVDFSMEKIIEGALGIPLKYSQIILILYFTKQS